MQLRALEIEDLPYLYHRVLALLFKLQELPLRNRAQEQEF